MEQKFMTLQEMAEELARLMQFNKELDANLKAAVLKAEIKELKRARKRTLRSAQDLAYRLKNSGMSDFELAKYIYAK